MREAISPWEWLGGPMMSIPPGSNSPPEPHHLQLTGIRSNALALGCTDGSSSVWLKTEVVGPTHCSWMLALGYMWVFSCTQWCLAWDRSIGPSCWHWVWEVDDGHTHWHSAQNIGIGSYALALGPKTWLLNSMVMEGCVKGHTWGRWVGVKGYCHFLLLEM